MTAPADERWIEVDLSDLGLSAPLTTLDELAGAASHLYERFVPYADEGWQWVTPPATREFDGWTYRLRDGELIVAGARLLTRQLSRAERPDARRAAHGVSEFRTDQLTRRPWTAEPGSKLWKPFTHA